MLNLKGAIRQHFDYQPKQSSISTLEIPIFGIVPWVGPFIVPTYFVRTAIIIPGRANFVLSKSISLRFSKYLQPKFYSFFLMSFRANLTVVTISSHNVKTSFVKHLQSLSHTSIPQCQVSAKICQKFPPQIIIQPLKLPRLEN